MTQAQNAHPTPSVREQCAWAPRPQARVEGRGREMVLVVGSGGPEFLSLLRAQVLTLLPTASAGHLRPG